MKSLTKFAVLSGLLFLSCAVLAQEPDLTLAQDYPTQQPLAAGGGRDGQALFGESIDLYTGATEFAFTDVSIPGNNALPVEVRRRFKAFDDGWGSYGGWEIDIPYMTGIYADRPGWSTGWVVDGPNPTSRCSASQTFPPISNTGFGSFYPDEFWHGVFLHVPGQGDVEMSEPSVLNSGPTDGPAYRWATRTQWFFSCRPTTANGVAGESFLARSPDGTKYYFDWLVSYRAMRDVKKPRGVDRPIEEGEAPEDSSIAILDRTEYRIFPTRIEDRFGNWVQYTYTGKQLTSILSNDGRQLTLTWSGGNLATVSDLTRTWTYDMNGNVTFPDGSHRVLIATRTENVTEVPRWFDCRDAVGPRPLGDLNISLQVPSGATATYTLRNLKRGVSNVPYNFNCFPDSQVGEGNGTIYNPIAFNGWAIASKSVTGPGMANQSWVYSYGPSNDSFDIDCTSKGGCPATRTLVITGPESSWTRHTFGNRYLQDEGKLLKVERGTSAANILEVQDYIWQLTPLNGAYPASVGTGSQASAGTSYPANYTHPLKSLTRTVQGTTFTMSVNSFDAFAQPTSVSRASSLGYNKSEVVAYYNDLSKWVLSQLATKTTNGKVESAYTYNAASARVATVTSFGKLQQSRTYRADGTLEHLRDGANNTTTYADYHRGIPRSITFPGGASKSLSVDDRGLITSVTDELGNTSGFGYDSMGRMSSITYPVGDIVGWTGTTIQTIAVAGSEYGIASGHWRRTETTGNRVSNTYYDGLWRPVLEESYDASDIGGTRSLVRRGYDGQGRESFVSYPVRSATSLTAITLGTHNAFDSLDRPTSTTADSELGALSTIIQYPTGFQRRITNPRSYVTTQSFQAFDVPSMDSLVLAAEPGGVTTTIARDIFGKPTSINRAGTYQGQHQSMTHTYVYDSNELLCKTYVPEEGTTYFDYDAAGNVAWSANGLAYDGSACNRANAPAGSRTYRAYDERNRLLTIDRPEDIYFDSTFTYYPDGALQTTYTLATTTSYQYNKRRLLELETTQLTGPNLNRSFSLDWAYSPLGDVSSLTYPDGYVLAYNPNALGQARQATGAFGGVNAGVQYHPNGSIAQFTYGNGISHSLTLNTRQLPLRSVDGGGMVVTDYTLTYDENANITTITDGRSGQPEQRYLGYDARDRMTSADAPNQLQAERYTYDALDNVRRMQMGPVNAYWIDFTYYYNSLNQLTSINNLDGSQWTGYGYDGRGNMTTRSGQTYTQSNNFDSANRIQYTTGGRYPVEYYAYNALGMRSVVDRYDGLSHRNFQIYSRAGQLLYEEDNRVGEPGNGKRKRYIMLGGTTVARHETPVSGGSTAVYYTHNSPVGSAHYETNAAGAQVFGQPLAPFGSIYAGTYTDRQGFTGHTTDANTQLTYMQQRYYDPVALRFLSVDPVGGGEVGANINRYWYANNNPYSYTDPDGRQGKVAWLVKFTTDGMRKVARLTQEQAVRARRAEENVVADRRQVASQIESSAHGRDGQLKHAAHELKNGEKGLPHYQTDGVKGHSFWGKLSAGVITFAAGLDQAAEAADLLDPTVSLTSGSGDLANHEKTWFGAYRRIDPSGPTYHEALRMRAAARNAEYEDGVREDPGSKGLKR